MIRKDGIYVCEQGFETVFLRFFDDRLVFLPNADFNVAKAAKRMLNAKGLLSASYDVSGKRVRFAYSVDKDVYRGSGEISSNGLKLSITIVRNGKQTFDKETYVFHPVVARILEGKYGAEDDAKELLKRIKEGTITRERVAAAAALGHKIASLAVKHPFKATRGFKAASKALAAVGPEACARALLAVYWDRDDYALCLTQERRVRLVSGTDPARALKSLARLLSKPSGRNLTIAKKQVTALKRGRQELERLLEVLDLESTTKRASLLSASLTQWADEDVKGAYRQLASMLVPWLMEGQDPYDS